jgi:hypothetical protein
MDAHASPDRQYLKIRRGALLWLYPRLRHLPPETWDAALDRARDTEFETAEWIGLLGGIAFAAWLLDFEASALAAQAPFIAHLLPFFLALPLLAVLVGPIYLRRTRRGLERDLTTTAIHNETTGPISARKGA